MLFLLLGTLFPILLVETSFRHHFHRGTVFNPQTQSDIQVTCPPCTICSSFTKCIPVGILLLLMWLLSECPALLWLVPTTHGTGLYPSH